MKNHHYYLKKITTWLLPYTCLLCCQASTRQQDLCQACLDDLPKLVQSCPRCAKPLPNNSLVLTCGDCLKGPTPFDCTHALFAYLTPITKLVMQLKFNHALINARILGELMADKIKHEWYLQKPLPDVLIPMPLHPRRLKERGFNQAVEIARPIAKALNLPIDKTHCLRIKQTSAQATLKAASRQKNIKNAFEVRADFSHKHIAVLDDVITTGFTITEFCNTLKKAGAQKIDVWCCARPHYSPK